VPMQITKVTTVFVGGLRKSTSEDKVIGHFAKYGQASLLRILKRTPSHNVQLSYCSSSRLDQVESVDIKRLPDGASRGFAFVKFADKEPLVESSPDWLSRS